MNREDRAKQFLPFDALKGLREELKRREEIALRTERRQLSEEESERLSKRLLRLKRGDTVTVEYYDSGHYRTLVGEVTSLDTVFGSLMLVVDGEKRAISFFDILRISS